MTGTLCSLLNSIYVCGGIICKTVNLWTHLLSISRSRRYPLSLKIVEVPSAVCSLVSSFVELPSVLLLIHWGILSIPCFVKIPFVSRLWQYPMLSAVQFLLSSRYSPLFQDCGGILCCLLFSLYLLEGILNCSIQYLLLWRFYFFCIWAVKASYLHSSL